MTQELVKKASFKVHTLAVRRRSVMYWSDAFWKVQACAISPDNTLLASGSTDKTLCITNIETKATVYTVKCDSLVRACFSCLFSHYNYSRFTMSRGRPTGSVLSP